MPSINIAEFADGFVIHFDTAGERINVYTLASTLVGIADAAKAANADINHGYDIEVVVEAIGPGSFRAFIRAIYKESGNLFSGESLRAIILAVVASFIYERSCAVEHPIKVEVYTKEVVIESGPNKVVVPREVYDATRIVENDPQFVRGINRTFEAIGSDDKVNGVAIVPKIDSSPPAIIIPQDTIRQIAIEPTDDPLTRVIEEQCDLQIVKAILERSTRKWEFMWRGVRISAPVLDQGFYNRFFAHAITIAPGDELKVRLAIKQSREPRTGIYTNIGYEVREVYEHVPRTRQEGLALEEQ